MPADVVLRDVADDDLPIFFVQRLDPQGNWMAAFVAKDNLASLRVLRKCGFIITGEE